MALYDPAEEDESQPIGDFMEAPGSPEISGLLPQSPPGRFQLPVISECKLGFN